MSSRLSFTFRIAQAESCLRPPPTTEGLMASFFEHLIGCRRFGRSGAPACRVLSPAGRYFLVRMGSNTMHTL